MFIMATPTQFMRGSLEQLAALKLDNPLLVNVAKGIEVKSLKRISEIAADLFGDNHRYVMLAGPSHAEPKAPKTIAASTLITSAISATRIASGPVLIVSCATAVEDSPAR